MDYSIKDLDADILTMVNQGFRMAKSGDYKDGKRNGNFDSLTPDIVMVKNGTVAGELLPSDFNAIACVHSNGLSNSFLHLTLSSETSAEQIDKLHNMGGFFLELKDGRHAGFVNMLPMGVRDKENVLSGFEDRMMEISSLKLKTEPYAFNKDVISLLPFMANKDGKLDNDDAFKIAEKLVSNLKEFSDSVDVPKNLLDRAMEAEMGYKPSLQSAHDSRPKMAPGMRPS
jgi:hypothetical protein